MPSPSTGVPADTVNLIPPVGSKGLPLTMVMADEFDDVIADAANTRMALFDEQIWTPRATGSGTIINPKSVVPAATRSPVGTYPIIPTATVALQRAGGLRITTSPPRLAANRGHLVSGQVGLDVGKSYHYDDQLKSTAGFAGISITEVGQYTAHPTRRYASARPANHTWAQNGAVGNATMNPQFDLSFGSITASGTFSCTDPSFIGGPRCENIVHYVAADVPSNGLGTSYGDNHNSQYLTTVVSSPVAIQSTIPLTGLSTIAPDSFTFSEHWCVNQKTEQQVMASGTSLSGPDGVPLTAPSGEDADSEVLLIGSNTVQQVLTHDVFADGFAPAENQPFAPLGRVDLGASVVADSSGLIGYEGTITATAFFAPTKETDPAGTQGAITNATQGRGYAGLNIQVHSGLPLRRNGQSSTFMGATVLQPYRYGSDNAVVMPMTDIMRTAAARGTGHSLAGGADANTSWFSNIRRTHISAYSTTNPIGDAAVGDVVPRPTSGVPDEGLIRYSGNRGDRIIGSNTNAGGGSNLPTDIDKSGSWSTGRWIADGIPTKVQVIPSLVGYTDVIVSTGTAKVAAGHPDLPLTFRKPIVDYHVLVSVISSLDAPDAKADTTSGITNTGSPTKRNDPNPNRLHIDADYSDLPCTIYHAIFRLDPTSLEQIFIDATAGTLAGLDMTSASCPSSVMPRHSAADGGVMQMGWGLHQATPFRPIAINDDNTRIPQLCATVEGGGFYQRGGISHLWDAAAYEGELFVGADSIDASDLCITQQPAPNAPFGFWGEGQIWPDGTAAAGLPRGCELLVWRYSPAHDPLYVKTTTFTNHPLLDLFPNYYSQSNAYDSTFDAITKATSTKITAYSESPDACGAVWEIHDWVFPQLELMRYLGREEKDAAVHPKSTAAATPPDPIYHPTLHCSSLRIIDDGRMLMAAVHVDYIKTENDYPSADIKYPMNPDLDTTECPIGYYYANGSCVPIGGEGADPPPDHIPDPQSGDDIPSAGAPAPVAGSGQSTPKNDNFSAYPTWSSMKANTQARSLILLWTDTPANPETGLVRRGTPQFTITWNTIPISDGTQQTIAEQTWILEDTWWSGSRLAYWYEESGQRAIPITYGSYPDCRMSQAHLPRSLPFITQVDGRDIELDIQHGFPLIQPVLAAAPPPSVAVADPPFSSQPNLDAWCVERVNFLKLTRFVPSTVGFADFGAGANPHQELGWSGWSFPQFLYDPSAFGDNTLFFSDAPEAESASPLVGGVIVPTEQALWSGFGDNTEDVGLGTNPYFPFNAHYIDLSTISFPATLESFLVGSPTAVEQLFAGPVVVASMAELLATLLAPHQSTYDVIDLDYSVATGGVPLKEEPTGFLVRIWDGLSPPAIESTMEWTSITIDSVGYPFQHYTNAGNQLMRGGCSGWSHNGPLHYGASIKLHPYRVDRVYKQVHGGVGYNIPLHLLAPPAVHVRARAGGSGGIELEMETPFHRTDNIHLLGASAFNVGFELGGESPPNASRPVAGQYYLRTNLWDAPRIGAGGASGAKVGGLGDYQRVHGPLVSGSFGLEAFWSDHPTDHFHAAAMPIFPDSDYDLAMIESNRYAPLMLARRNQMHDLDVVATSEQLLSSVDVHVSQTARPYWDSGAVVSAQGVGWADPLKGSFRVQMDSEMDGLNVHGPSTFAGNSGNRGQGKGQRILRTPEGTLHIFHLRRSCQSGSENYPQWTHMKKPLHGDLFFNRRAMKPDPDSAVHDGKDEVGPTLESVGAGNLSLAEYDRGKVMGAAFASDSDGTIHAVIEYHPNPDDASTARAHRLYYHRAVRTLHTYNPEPVYDWDWSVHTPVLIQSHLASNYELGGTRWDLREPSLVCDSHNRLHLAMTQVLSIPASSGLPQCSRIIYTTKLADEDSFPDFAPADTATFDDSRYQIIHLTIADANDAAANSPTAPPHYTNYCDKPRVVLRGDNIPLVFYRGFPIQSFITTNRRYDAIYVNIGESPTGINDPSGRFTFDATKCCHVVGLGPDTKNRHEEKDVVYYDAIIDERDRAIVVSSKDDRETSPTVFAPRQTLLTFFDTRKTLAEQYTSAEGLGNTITLWDGIVWNGTSELRAVDPAYRDMTLTTNGKGEIHLVMSFTIIGSDDGRFGQIYRDASLTEQSAIAPIQWPATPSGQLNVSGVEEPYTGGFIKPAVSPNASRLLFPPVPPYVQAAVGMEHQHIMHCWIPSVEFDSTANVLRSVNIRWLSVPSLRWDSMLKTWSPVGSAQTLAGEEDFPHHSPQIRYQRFWGYDASELDLRWNTNELSWYRTPHGGANLFYPSAGGIQLSVGESSTEGEGVAGYPDGA